MECVESFLRGDDSDEDDQKSYRAFIVMAIAVAAFLAFTQCNITGLVTTLSRINSI